mgnify:CR=1 FL=1
MTPLRIMKITPHFSAEEFACRDGTPYPSAWIGSRLRPLCELLEIIRADLEVPIDIVSGYRTKTYNKHIGGARQSQHVQGRAADIIAGNLSVIMPAKVHAAILELYDTNSDVQRLLGGLGSYQDFSHLDVRKTDHLVRWKGSRIVS